MASTATVFVKIAIDAQRNVKMFHIELYPDRPRNMEAMVRKSTPFNFAYL